MYTIIGIHASKVDDVWNRIEHFTQAALDRTEGEMAINDVKQYVEDRDMQLWVICDEEDIVGALITEVLDFPRKKACRYVTLGGDLKDAFPVIDQSISAWAKSLGCDRMELIGRRGWSRAIKNLGYNEAYVYVTKDISDG